MEATSGFNLENIDAAEMTRENISQVKQILDMMFTVLKAALPTIVFALVTFLIGFVIINVIMRIINRGFERSKADVTVTGFLRSAVKIALYVILIVIVLSVLKVPMTSIITVIGTGGLAIVLALKDSLSNVAGGILILFSKPLKVGDYIEFDGTAGFVHRINLLYTSLKTYENITVYIPNAKILEGKIKNFSEEKIRRVDLEFEFSYEDDFKKVKAVLERAADKEYILKEKQVEVYIKDFGSSGIKYILRAWTRTENYWKAYYGLIENVKMLADEEGIEMPFMQVDIHNKTSMPADEKEVKKK